MRSALLAALPYASNGNARKHDLVAGSSATREGIRSHHLSSLERGLRPVSIRGVIWSSSEAVQDTLWSNGDRSDAVAHRVGHPRGMHRSSVALSI